MPSNLGRDNHTKCSKLFYIVLDIARLVEDGGTKNLGGSIDREIANS